MNFVQLMRDALARVVVIREALEDGDRSYAYTVATDLEIDLAGGLALIGDDEPRFSFNAIPTHLDPKRIEAWARAYLDAAA